MLHDDLKEKAKAAIQDLFGDSSVSPSTTKESLKELIEEIDLEIDLFIDSLPSDDDE